MSKYDIPIACIAFNRPEETVQVLAVLSEVRPAIIYLIMDGAREEVKGEKEKCDEVFKLFTSIPWHCELKINRSDVNLGCRKRIQSGLDWVFTHEERAVILEDDCVPTKSFFNFCEVMLEKYESDSSVTMISGTNYLPKEKWKEGYYRLPIFSIWGWATWRSRYIRYDRYLTTFLPKQFFQQLRTVGVSRLSSLNKMYSLLRVALGRIDTWGIQWDFTCVSEEGVAIVPGKNLISNIDLVGCHSSRGETENHGMLSEEIKSDECRELKLTDEDQAWLFRRIFDTDAKRYDKMLMLYLFFTWKASKISYLIHKLFYRIVDNNHIIVGRSISGGKKALLIYITAPFVVGINQKHQNEEQVLILADLVSNFGYSVDVGHFQKVTPEETIPYDLVIDITPGIRTSHYKQNNTRGTYIAYMTGSNPVFSNERERQRINRVKEVKGVELTPRRYADETPDDIYNKCDAMLIVGDEKTSSTYDGVHVPKSLIVNNSSLLLRDKKVTNRTKNSFLFVGGNGQVLKGLDILLEIFTQRPEWELHICTDLSHEKEFERLYHKELYSFPHIHMHGFVSCATKKFQNIASCCSWIIGASASEGMAGSVLNGMGSGLIPIITRQCGIDSGEGFYVDDETVEGFSTVFELATSLPLQSVSVKASQTLLRVKEHYSVHNFVNSVDTALRRILTT